MPALFTVLLCCTNARAQGPVPLGELFPSDANGQKTLQLAGSGMSVVSGSDLSAGIAAATLKLYRGGEVRICPHSGLNVSASGRGLNLATGEGSLEVDYELTQESADVLITPDFNITLPGPGRFHFSLGVSKNGNTCVKPMEGNSAELAFSELLGSGTYKSKADEAVLFLTGKLDQHSDFTGECGCPAPAPVMRAAPQPTPALPQPTPTPAPEKPVTMASSASSAAASDHANPVHVEVDTPFVFSARPSGDRPYAVAKIHLSTLPNVVFVQEQVDPIVLPLKPAEVSSKAKAQTPKPAAPPKKEKKGFFGRMKGFFGPLFHR
ncbi:MAG TPA: hypothetical protein VFR84_11500 [Candidatus Angelobacter sp.]|nr:hypothetical protein [Candidatus Angelobacter sp.]